MTTPCAENQGFLDKNGLPTRIVLSTVKLELFNTTYNLVMVFLFFIYLQSSLYISCDEAIMLL